MKTPSKTLLSCCIWIVVLAGAIPSSATTISDVLDGIASAKKPPGLASLSFMGDMRLDLDVEAGGMLPEQTSLLAAWRAPNEWFCTYELSGEVATGLRGLGGGHPAVDHVLLSRPDFLDVLDVAWTAQYQGTALWEGAPAWQLLFTTRDITLDTPPFTLYVRKDDFFPLRTVVEFADGTKATTDLTWIILEGTVVPSRFTTRFEPPAGPLAGFQTTYFNHDINPDLSGIEFPREEGSVVSSSGADEGPAVFEELYHGFADEPIIAPIKDSSGTYDRLEFTFSLYVEDPSITRELDRRLEPITTLAIEIVSEWEWSGEDGLSSPGGKYECGREILQAISELLGSDAITDFYFLDFDPLEPGEEP